MFAIDNDHAMGLMKNRGAASDLWSEWTAPDVDGVAGAGVAARPRISNVDKITAIQVLNHPFWHLQ